MVIENELSNIFQNFTFRTEQDVEPPVNCQPSHWRRTRRAIQFRITKFIKQKQKNENDQFLQKKIYNYQI